MWRSMSPTHCNPSSRHSSEENSMQVSSERHLNEETDDTDAAHMSNFVELICNPSEHALRTWLRKFGTGLHATYI